MSERNYVVKSRLSVIDGPMSHEEARDMARTLNEQYHTDEYRVAEWLTS